MVKALLLGFLMSLAAQHPEEVARYNAYVTLHMASVYGAAVKCVPFEEDPKDPNLYRCVADSDEFYIRLYCASDVLGANLCTRAFVVVK